MKYKLSMFNFDLPEARIAKKPVAERDDTKLMIVHKNTGEIEHKVVSDLKKIFVEGDVVVLNNTKVFPARLHANKEKTGAMIEVFLLRELDKENRLWDVLVDPARKIRIGNKLYFGENDDLVAEVIDNTTSRGRTLRFLYDGSYEEFKKTITNLGMTPLPKYINREPVPEDKERYQTIFAKEEGAVAAPTAGLHFSKQLMKRLEIKGVDFTDLTLHVGLGTFRPVDVEDLTKHKMDSEQLFIPQATADKVNQTKAAKKKVCAIGTTVTRGLETAVSVEKQLKPYDGWTNKFIFPPYEFSIPDAMITNFHTPKSTLIMMVSAYGGYDLIMKAYKEAIKEKYRFYSYGDAMLIL